MVPFIDPRDNPHPEAGRTPSRLINNPEALKGLHRLCSECRLYEVEKWIRSGEPLQVSPGRLGFARQPKMASSPKTSPARPTERRRVFGRAEGP